MTKLLKKTSALDLAIEASRKRISLESGYIHSENRETIPIYENFCFALALLRRRLTANILEAKELLTKLYGFQTEEGNFPIRLHEYPRTYDPHMSLKIAPILIHALQSGCLGRDLNGLTKKVLSKALQKKPIHPIWINRYLACKGEKNLKHDETPVSSNEWVNSIVTNQLVGKTHFSLPVDMYGFIDSAFQEGSEPKPTVLDWLIHDGNYRKHLLKDHPHQIQLGAILPISYTSIPYRHSSIRILWEGDTLHSFVGLGTQFLLDTPFEPNRKDLFEVAFYTDISKETQVFIEGKRGTYFSLNQTVTVITPQKQIDVRFILLNGEGDFSGHIFPANRPSQILKDTAYDWQIGLRTLRRSNDVSIKVEINSSP